MERSQLMTGMKPESKPEPEPEPEHPEQYKSWSHQEAVAAQKSLESAGVDPVAKLTEQEPEPEPQPQPDPQPPAAVGVQANRLDNPIAMYKEQYVFNMWKYYNHNYKKRAGRKQLAALVSYCMYSCMLLYMLTYLPPPAEMRRHHEAVSDLLLGEEFDSNTTHIFKSYYDVMTAEEMWQWATGPLSAALLVDGKADGNLGALLGTNWLLGPVRIRQERSHNKAETCEEKLHETFGTDVGTRLVARGVKCTASWTEPNKGKNNGGDDSSGGEFVNLTRPLAVLGGLSFIEAFPEWYHEYATPIDNSVTDATYCCSLSGCFDNDDQQQEKIENSIEKMDSAGFFQYPAATEFACSVDLKNKMLALNPPGAYRSTIKGDSTESPFWLSGTREFGNGGFHIDLPGNSSTFVKQLKALEELEFVDQFTRSVTFQFMLINANEFLPSNDERVLSFLSAVDQEPVVVACVDINFVFSPSGHLKSYERITPMQMMPLGFLGVTSGDDQVSYRWVVFVFLNAIPLLLIYHEVKLFVNGGVVKWIRTGWSWFEIVYIFLMWRFCQALIAFLNEEAHFLERYRLDGEQYKGEDKILYNSAPENLFNDSLALRGDYRKMFKSLGLVLLVAVFKVFKYARVFKPTMLLWDSLTLAKTQLLTFSVVMVLLVCAFGVCGTLYWGNDSLDFHNIPTSFFSLLRMAAGEGEVDYQELKRGDAGMTPYLFFGFTMIVTILAMNLMIGIVTDFYEEARDTLKLQDKETAWIQRLFDSDEAEEYDDVYRGQGLWNEPASQTGLGDRFNAIVEALWGSWTVRPVPGNQGPRSWNEENEEVEFEKQIYPFVLHRSDVVHLRYKLDAHEHFSGQTTQNQMAGAQKEADEITRNLDKTHPSARAALISADTSQTVKDPDFWSKEDDVPTKTNPTPPLQLWMAPGTLAQYGGIDYLEKLRAGDRIHLITPSEGGLPGEIELESTGRVACRRAKLQHIAQVDRKIREKQRELHREPGDKRKVEQELQDLHRKRMLLEGVDKIMQFKVSKVETWQKFRPLSHSLGEELKKEASQEGDGTTISLEAVVDVVEQAVKTTVSSRLSGSQASPRSDHVREQIKLEIKNMAEDEERSQAEKKDVQNASSECCTCGGKRHHDGDETSGPMSSLHSTKECLLCQLISDGAAQPIVTSAMKRLMKRAQRIYDQHTPLIEIKETAHFELQIPSEVKRKLLCCQNFPTHRVRQILCKVIPGMGMAKWFYFHTTISEDVEDFLKENCTVSIRAPRDVRHSPKLLMRELMSHRNSLSLDDFICQLEHFTFKIKPNTIEARLRKFLHRILKKTCLDRCFIGLRSEIRTFYTPFEAEFALRYCITRYNEFIDHRRGSLPGYHLHEGGVWLHNNASSELEKVFRSRLQQEDSDEEEADDNEVEEVAGRKLDKHCFEGKHEQMFEELIDRVLVRVHSLDQSAYTKRGTELAKPVQAKAPRTRHANTATKEEADARRDADDAAPLKTRGVHITVQSSREERESLLAESAELDDRAGSPNPAVHAANLAEVTSTEPEPEPEPRP